MNEMNLMIDHNLDEVDRKKKRCVQQITQTLFSLGVSIHCTHLL